MGRIAIQNRPSGNAGRPVLNHEMASAATKGMQV